MMSVAIADATHVAVSTAPASIPAADNTAGCTKMMYAIVRNVVVPARISVRMVVPAAESPNRRSMEPIIDGHTDLRCSGGVYRSCAAESGAFPVPVFRKSDIRKQIRRDINCADKRSPGKGNREGRNE